MRWIYESELEDELRAKIDGRNDLDDFRVKNSSGR